MRPRLPIRCTRNALDTLTREDVTVEPRGDLALVGIDRPPANALELQLLDEGHAALAALEAPAPAAVVMVGREGFFSAGVDLKLDGG